MRNWNEPPMSPLNLRTLSVGPLRAFETVCRTLNFRIAAEQLHLTQSAVSRQVKALEDEVGARLLERDTRGVQVTPAGLTLLQSLGPWLGHVDMAVRRIRQAEGRRVVGLSTFVSFASLWVLPRLEHLRRLHAMDVRVLSQDQISAADFVGAGRTDAVIRYCRHGDEPEGSMHLFDEVLTPVASPRLIEGTRGDTAPAHKVADLARHTLIEDLDLMPSAEYRSWSRWLRDQGLADMQPRHWLYFNMAHQQVEAARIGQGWALGRLPMVIDQLLSGDLVEPFGQPGRLAAPYAYWLIVPVTAGQDESSVLLREWIVEQAALTRAAILG